MTALVAAAGGAPLSVAALQGAVAEMASRGAEVVDVCASDGGWLAAGRFAWEVHSTSPGPIVLDDGVRVVAADASLYYRDALRRSIAEATASRPFELGGDSASHLLLGAYRAWGADCARHLEGDFAFAIWDRESRTLTCARDFSGSRPLFYGRDGDRVVVASMASVVARRTAHEGALNVVALGESIAGLFNLGDDTSYLGVSIVRPGHTLVKTPDGVTLRPHWEPPVPTSGRPTSFEEGAEELRALLTDAVDERLIDAGTTALWLSGGWDSSSILACAMRALERRPARRKLVLVSMSYPVGNLGREDEVIQSIADRFGGDVSWCQSTDVPLLAPAAASEAAERDLPFAHAFEMWSRTMVTRSRELGAHVVLTGTGGDELFAGTNLYLSDLLRRGSWLSLAMEWYRIRGRTLRGFEERVVHPALASRLGYRDLTRPGPFEQRILPWLREDFVRRHELRERERTAAPYGRYDTLSATEQVWSITAPMFPRIRSTLGAAQLRAGVVSRSPFLDGRLVRFAMSRPRTERVVARETKRLLRRAMKGLLPDEFLAPRPNRTGITTQYMRDEMCGPARPLFDAAFERPLLAELGIIDAERLRADWREYVRSGEGLGLRYYEAYQVELWVRAHLEAGSGRASSPELLPTAAS